MDDAMHAMRVMLMLLYALSKRLCQSPDCQNCHCVWLNLIGSLFGFCRKLKLKRNTTINTVNCVAIFGPN